MATRKSCDAALAVVCAQGNGLSNDTKHLRGPLEGRLSNETRANRAHGGDRACSCATNSLAVLRDCKKAVSTSARDLFALHYHHVVPAKLVLAQGKEHLNQ